MSSSDSASSSAAPVAIIPTKSFKDCPSFIGWSACDDGSIWFQGKAMPYNMQPSGYLQVDVSQKGQRMLYNVHKIVADAFLGPRPEGFQIDHKNEIKTDNRAENLHYLSISDHAKKTTLSQ